MGNILYWGFKDKIKSFTWSINAGLTWMYNGFDDMVNEKLKILQLPELGKLFRELAQLRVNVTLVNHALMVTITKDKENSSHHFYLFEDKELLCR